MSIKKLHNLLKLLINELKSQWKSPIPLEVFAQRHSFFFANFYCIDSARTWEESFIQPCNCIILLMHTFYRGVKNCNSITAMYKGALIIFRANFKKWGHWQTTLEKVGNIQNSSKLTNI